MKKWKPRATDIFCICSRNEFAEYNDIISSSPIIMNRDYDLSTVPSGLEQAR